MKNNILENSLERVKKVTYLFSKTYIGYLCKKDFFRIGKKNNIKYTYDDFKLYDNSFFYTTLKPKETIYCLIFNLSSDNYEDILTKICKKENIEINENLVNNVKFIYIHNNYLANLDFIQKLNNIFSEIESIYLPIVSNNKIEDIEFEKTKNIKYFAYYNYEKNKFEI